VFRSVLAEEQRFLWRLVPRPLRESGHATYPLKHGITDPDALAPPLR
jgi:hypothetical protein